MTRKTHLVRLMVDHTMSKSKVKSLVVAMKTNHSEVQREAFLKANRSSINYRKKCKVILYTCNYTASPDRSIRKV